MTDKKVDMPGEIWAEATESAFSEMIVGDWTSEEYGGVQQTPYLRKDLVVRKEEVRELIKKFEVVIGIAKNEYDIKQQNIGIEMVIADLAPLLNGGKDE